MLDRSGILSFLFPSLVWRMNAQEKSVYLTFDDGPVPVITPWVLEMLSKYNAKATFFCIGNNVKKHGDIYKSILAAGHKTGNHTFDHLNAWKISNEKYLTNVYQAEKMIASDLFRPPYGKITPALIKVLKRDYRIIMWDVLSYDFDNTFTGMQCSDRVIRKGRNGAVIVFHDSVKAEERLRIALPAVLEYFSKNNYQFKSIP